MFLVSVLFILLAAFNEKSLSEELVNSFKIDNQSDTYVVSPIALSIKKNKKFPEHNFSFGVPTGYGSFNREFYVGLKYHSDIKEGPFVWYDSNNRQKADASMDIGFGFGDPIKSIGSEFTLGIISMASQDGESPFGKDGTFGIKLHKHLSKDSNLATSLGWANVIKWGEASTFDTYYLAISKIFDVSPKKANKFTSMITLGIGTGEFRSKESIDDLSNDPNLFGSFGVQILPRVSIGSSWDGRGLNAGVNFMPLDIPLSISVGYKEIVEDVSDDGVLSIETSYVFRY